MRGFETTVEHLDGAVRVALHGELDLDHAYDFDVELRRLEASQPRCLILDLRDLRFLDSSGLARLLAARRRARRDRRRLVLVRGTATVQRLFALTALDEQFEMVSAPPAG
jgi:anti-sigma B factor antagonist